MTRHLLMIIGLLALLGLLTTACSSDGPSPDAGDAAVGDVIYYEPPVTNPVEDMPVYPDTGAVEAAVGQVDLGQE